MSSGKETTSSSQPDKVVRITPPTDEANHLWQKVVELAAEFGEDREWALVGGLMVQLLAYEHGAESRPTTDIDILADARSRPSMTRTLAKTLDGLGAEMATPPSTDPLSGYQFELDGQVIEVLGPDGLRSDPQTLGNYESIQVDGGTQALQRTEKVAVSVSGAPAIVVRRPTLLGAILLKARALARIKAKEAEHRQDLIRLLSFVEDPRGLALAGGLTDNQRQWLQRIKSDLCWDDAEVRQLFDPAALEQARAAYELLTA